MPRWIRGMSGNPRGRPRKGTAVADAVRAQIDKHRLVDKLGSIAAGVGGHGDVSADQQLRAIQLLLAYGYGPPKAESEHSGGLVVQVNYVQRDQIAITSTPPGATACDPGSQAVQCGLLRPALGQNGTGDGSTDPPGTPG